MLIQAIGSNEPGVHLDIHTDDLDAEVSRLLVLGASERSRHGGWVVMNDPSGLTFCVVPVDSDDESLLGATVWP